jgi:hypothetical protein
MRIFVPVLACALSLAASDFTGAWQLLVAQSDFGRANPPKSQRVVVKQNGDQIQVHSTLVDARGSFDSEYSLDASGKPVDNTIRGARVSSTASWRGGVLHVKSKTSMQNTEIKSVDQWQLDGNGKRLVIYRTATTSQGDVEQRYVYEKVPE